MIPRFLIADNSQELPERVFVVHTQTPKCIIGGHIEDFDRDREIFWLDEALGEKELNQLLQDAEQFLDDELMYQDDLFDEEEAN